ncbi:unnamed protein product, partial [Iphiclides podalirius]
MSCLGLSKQSKGVSYKVNKKKYVKRILNDAKEASIREETASQGNSTSQCACLTPDKSIHVNKAPDPFDLLLKSSPAHVESSKSFLMIPGRKYGNKSTKTKKCNNVIHENMDSDKENSKVEFGHISQNISDIKNHKLIIEQVDKNSLRYHDESINNVLKNMPILTNNHQNSQSNSIKRDMRLEIKNVKPTVLESSPLCSTPFQKKYRKTIQHLNMRMKFKTVGNVHHQRAFNLLLV